VLGVEVIPQPRADRRLLHQYRASAAHPALPPRGGCDHGEAEDGDRDPYCEAPHTGNPGLTGGTLIGKRVAKIKGAA
jgi:hypothetical protein